MNSNISLLDIVGKGYDAVQAFVVGKPLAACDDDGGTLVAIMASHLDWPNAVPEPGGPIGYSLKIAQAFCESVCSLPACNEYRALRIVAAIPCLTLEIDTVHSTVTTNVQELSRTLSPWLVKTEAQRQAAFATLSGKFRLPPPRPPRQPFHSRILGPIEPDDLNDGKRWSIAIPYFDHRLIAVTLNERGPAAIITPEDAAHWTRRWNVSCRWARAHVRLQASRCWRTAMVYLIRSE